MKKLLVFQHIECEHPGLFRSYLKEDNVEVFTVNFDQGDAIPELIDFDALWVMGGPMDVWDTEEFPWLIDEIQAIKQWVLDLKKPYFGLCLGHQLLAVAIGGKCNYLKVPEIGVLEIELNAQGIADPIFKDLPERQTCLQWHSVEVSHLPDDVAVLASSPQCGVQAMRVGEKAWSMQYHIEAEEDTIENWSQIPAYWDSLMKAIGEEGLAKMNKQFANHTGQFARHSKQLYDNFISYCFTY